MASPFDRRIASRAAPKSPIGVWKVSAEVRRLEAIRARRQEQEQRKLKLSTTGSDHDIIFRQSECLATPPAPADEGCMASWRILSLSTYLMIMIDHVCMYSMMYLLCIGIVCMNVYE